METKLTKTQQFFLLNYKTEDDMFTSQKEMESVEKALNLSSLTKEELRSVRNDVVFFYHGWVQKLEAEGKEGRDIAYNLWNSMSSVTAVVDHYSIKSGKNIVF